MREPIRDRGRLEHILTSINNIFKFAEGRTDEQITEDRMCHYAIIYQLVVIGEASNLLTKEFRENHSETVWRKIIGMRNFVVHGYDIVDETEVLKVVKDDLLILKAQIEKYLNE